ncbi:hypothetical protein CDL12_02253 [Handroanthus impetiginosus]|uniref:CI111 double-psi beta barrel domain-containing protein n=1 Tax=Handroanthus impetiginosus TaxID=429701 RepID=A0A2G9I5F9_9LAMI|nr:hypothetical protein CDL12_02253 [Handroanthus impetiginosus]
MPSKKKNSRTPSKVSNSAQNRAFSSSPAVSTSISSTLNSSNEQLLSSLDKASAKFPSLISRTAFIGTVVDTVVPKDSKPKDCLIWLPESAMGPSIYPGSHVSVSLYSMDKSAGGFSLSELSDECARNFGFDLADNLADEAGNFFAIATASASREVPQNGVRLSEDLSYTLGCPASGRTIFVCPVERNSSSETGNDERCGLTASISLDNYKELYLSPVYLNGKVEMEGALQSHLELFEKDSNGQIVNSNISTLKTPSLSMSKLSFSSLLQSLGHDSSRKCLETCIRSCLNRRNLLCGNFVRVPVAFRHYVFQVVVSKRL